MDLSVLKDVLGVRDVRINANQQLEHVDSSLVAEIFARHRNSTQPESQQLCIILSAVLEVIKAEGMQPTPTALFAALMASLEKPETQSTTEISAGVCNLLSQVLPRVPNNVLKSKFAPATDLLLNILIAKGSETSIARTALPCLVQMLAGARPTDWTPAVPAFNYILARCLDSRPKIRKKAQAGVVEILASLQGTGAVLATASDQVVKLSQQVLPGPEAAARAAAEAPSKKRKQAEEAVTTAVAAALYLIGTMKQCSPLLAEPAIASISELLLALYPLKQPLLTRGATDVLSVLCTSPSSHLPARALSSLLQTVLGGDGAAAMAATTSKDAGGALGFINLMEAATGRLYEQDPAAGASILPHAVHALIPLLASQHDSIRMVTSTTLCDMLNQCVTPSDVAAAVSSAQSKERSASSLQRTIAAVESSLGPRYQDAWESCLPVAATTIEVLGRNGAALAIGLLSRIGDLCAGADAAAEEGESDEQLTLAAQTALGAALRALGPEVVLEVLPLGLQEGLQGDGEARTWLLPLMRQHVRGARLGYWAKDMLALAREMGDRAAQAERNPARAKEAKVCSVLENQIWATLPSFCSWAEDIPQVFQDLSKPMSKAFQKRPELRSIICNAIQRICAQTRAALRHHDSPVGHADPSNIREELDTSELSEEDAVHLEVPSTFTLKQAKANFKTLRETATTWLPILLDAFVSAPPERRTQLEAAISVYACICDASMLVAPFKSAVTKMIEAAQQAQQEEEGLLAPPAPGGDTPNERRCTYMEAALSLAGGLPEDALVVLYKAAAQAAAVKDPALQKKAYKILSYLCEARSEDFLVTHFADMLRTLLDGVSTSVSAAKRYRLRCLKAVILQLTEPGTEDLDLGDLSSLALMGDIDQSNTTTAGSYKDQKARQVVASMVSEIVLCLKEANKRARAEAYTLLVEVAAAMHAADPPPAAVYGFDDVDMDMMPSEGGGAVVGFAPGPARTISNKNKGDEAASAIGRSEQGGLHALFTMVLGGLVGSTPHMISATVMGLARLLYDFAPVLAGLVPELMPAVLMLLRSKAREVIKSVLGFVKVVVVRLPAEELTPFIPSILEGILLWAEDSKNKFRLKVRVIIERLARKCGFEALDPHMPESHRALLTHIRKQKVRADKKKSESHMDWEGDEEDEQGVDAKSRRSGKTGKTAWTDAMFSDDDEDEDRHTRNGDARTIRTIKTVKSAGGASRRDVTGGKSVRSAKIGSSARLPAGGDPVDLLDASTSRRLVKAAAGVGGGSKRGGDGGGVQEPDFAVDKQGRLVIRDEEETGGKRKRRGEYDSDDSDFEDLKGFTGTELALKGAKSVAMAPSIAASLGGKSLGAKTMGAKSLGRTSMGGKSLGARSAPAAEGRRSHTGDRFKPKKGKAGGDVKGRSKVEPYAYWPLDRKLLNRREQKTRTAKAGLDKIVNAATEGAAKGRKAKRTRR